MTHDTHKQLLGIVIRADGTVPFDEGLHPTHRAAMLAHLTDLGHSYDPVEGTRHVRIRDWTPPAKP